jgi:hypothetical protein
MTEPPKLGRREMPPPVGTAGPIRHRTIGETTGSAKKSHP